MHSIRLRHPWQCQPVGEGSLWSRKFNWPAELEDGETVWLVVAGEAPQAAPLLNSQPLDAASAGRYPVTSLLVGHNLLALSHVKPPPANIRDCPFDVRLEIEDVGSKEA